MQRNSSNIIIKPWITEKVTRMSNDGQYTFLVAKSANSKQIKEELKRIYNVTAIRVNILAKTLSSSEKKAVVKLKEGEKIDIIPQ